MPWGAQQWLEIMPETSYGVYNSGGSPMWVRLPKNSPFSMRPDVSKTRKIIRSADGGNRRRQVVSARTAIAGNLSTLLYPTQTANWLNWATVLTSNNLSSFSINYYDSVRVRRYLGVMIESLKITSTAEQDHNTLDLSLIGQSMSAHGSDPTLAQPAVTVFPTELPYEHFESAGQLTFTATPTVITKYKSWELSIKNMLKGTWDESPFISALYYCGRDIDLSFELQYLADTWRPYFEASTPVQIACGFARTGTGNTLAISLETNNYVADLPAEDIPLDNASYQKVGIQTFYDATNTTDFGYTLT